MSENEANETNGAQEPETDPGSASKGGTGALRGSTEPVLPPAPQVPKEDLAPPPAVPKEELPPPPEVDAKDLSPAPQVLEEDLYEAPSVPPEALSSVPEVPVRGPSSPPEATGVPSPPAAPQRTPETSQDRIGEDEIGESRRPDPGDVGPWRERRETLTLATGLAVLSGGLLLFLLRRRRNSRANQTIRLIIEHGHSGLNHDG